MHGYPRYAIYYAPPHGSDLDRFGSHLLGYDAGSGQDLPFPPGIDKAIPDWRALTKDPRKYGFHATLKAPFALRPENSEADLLQACEQFAEAPRVVPVIQPVIEAISGFIAVVPLRLSAELAQFAADCTREFDTFRSPLTAKDRARRNPASLTPRQLSYLERWGYPYVIEEFRFHMTLTERLDAQRRETVRTILRERFETLKISTLPIDRIALFRQYDANLRFRVIKQYELKQLEE